MLVDNVADARRDLRQRHRRQETEGRRQVIVLGSRLRLQLLHLLGKLKSDAFAARRRSSTVADLWMLHAR